MAADIVLIEPTRAALANTHVSGPSPALAYLARLRSESGRRAMRWKLDQAARILSGGRADALSYPWATMTPALVTGLASALVSDRARPDAGPYAARTVNATLAAVRGVLRECWRAGLIDADQLKRLCDVAPEPVTGEPAGRGLEPGEVSALFRAARADSLPSRGARDAALLACLFGAGLRAGEAVALDLGDVDLDAEALHVRRGKGRKMRVVPLAMNGAAALAAWIHIRGDADGALLASIDRRGNVGGRLSTRAVQRIVLRLAAAAGVEPFSPHDARRSYIGAYLDAGVDLATVQQLAGHSSPMTTARYDRRPGEARRRAARMLVLPVG